VAEYQISQRADFFEVEVGLETTLKRPIINTRDEPHADPERHRRLHVIVGDANLSDTATFLKLGTTSLMLAMIEAGSLSGHEWIPVRPVSEMHAVSHDRDLQHRIELKDGRRLTALEIQRDFLDQAVAFCGTDPDEQTQQVLDAWAEVLDALAEDRDALADRIDWIAKLSVMEGFVRREGLQWSSPRLQLIDLQYADLRPERGLAAKLESRGRLRRMFTDAEVLRAVDRAPEDTRAYFRGECIRRYADSVAAASWDSVVFDIPGRDALLRVPTLEPVRGTKAHVEELLDAAADAATLIDLLTPDTSR
jgi:proteasome accessory factor A